MRGLKSLFSRLFRLFSNLGQSSLLCTCIAYEAGTHLTGNDIIQKYCMKHDPTFIHFIGWCTESQSTWCELKITWAVENFCPAPVKREKLLNKYFLPLPHFLQQLVIANEALYNFYLFDFGSFFFFFFLSYIKLFTFSLCLERTLQHHPPTLFLFLSCVRLLL